MDDLLQALLEAPAGSLILLAGLVLVLVAAGLTWKFTPGKWGRIYAAVAGSVLVASGLYIVQTATPTTEVGEAAACQVSGTVFNHDNSQPFGGVELYYDRRTVDESSAIHESKSRLAETTPQGAYQFDCSTIEDENFPALVWLRHPAWALPVPTRLSVEKGREREGEVIWVSDGEARKVVKPAGTPQAQNLPVAIVQPTRPIVLATATVNIDPARLQTSGLEGIDIPNRR